MEKELKIEFKSDYKLYKKMYFHFFIFYSNYFRICACLLILILCEIIATVLFISLKDKSLPVIIAYSVSVIILSVTSIAYFIIAPAIFMRSADKQILNHENGMMSDGHTSYVTFGKDKIYFSHDEISRDYNYEDVLGYFYCFSTLCIYIGKVYSPLSSELSHVLLYPVASRDEFSAFFKEKNIEPMQGKDAQTHYVNTYKLARKRYKANKNALE